MSANAANVFLFVHHVAKRLVKKFLLFAICFAAAVYLFLSLARDFHLVSTSSTAVSGVGNGGGGRHDQISFGRGRASSSLLTSGKFVAPSKKSAFLVVCVLSAPSNARERQAARDSWLTLKDEIKAGVDVDGGVESARGKNEVIPLFVVGGRGLDADARRTLALEMERHADLLILDDLVDSYANLTLKIVHAYSWIDAHLASRYVLKLDDDSYARIDVLVEELRGAALGGHERLYWGFFDGRARPFKKGKWSESTWNLCDLYIPYALGGGYVVSANLVAYVARNAPDLRLFFNEDVAMGTWLAPLDVFRLHDPRFDTEFKSRGCFSSYVVTHKQTAAMLKEKHGNLVETGSICGGPQHEFRSRLSYDYNWTVPPSQCCHRGKNNLT